MVTEEIANEVRLWFSKYAVQFSELASNMRANTAVLLDYYTVPVRIVGQKADMVMLSPDAVVGFGGVGAQLEHLRRNGLVEAKISDLSVSLSNMRAAVIEATWKRSFLTGDGYSVDETYIVVHGPLGWRIATVIEKSQ